MATPASLSVFAGDELTFEVEVVNESATAPPVTLAGAHVACALFRPPVGSESPVAALTVSSTSGGADVISVTDPAIFLVTFTPLQTRLLTGRYAMEAKVRFPSGRVETVARAKLKVGVSALLDLP